MNQVAVNPSNVLYLWPLRTLYIGQLGRLSPMSQGAHALMFALDAPLSVRIGEHEYRSRSLLVPAGTRFHPDTRGQRIACCFLDPLGRDFLYLQSQMRRCHEGVYVESVRQAEQLSALERLWQQGADARTAYRQLTDVLFPGTSTQVPGFSVDERIARVVDMIRADPADNISNDELAARVGLSGARLQRLFKESTGIPIRRYRLWHRLFVTSSMMAMGSTLTDAALAAGFSDSSHLTHVFRSMLGMKPSMVLRRSRDMRILVGTEQ